MTTTSWTWTPRRWRGVRRGDAASPLGVTFPRASARGGGDSRQRAAGGGGVHPQRIPRAHGLPRWTSFEEMTGGETRRCRARSRSSTAGTWTTWNCTPGCCASGQREQHGRHVAPHRARVRVTARRRRERRVVLGGETRRRGHVHRVGNQTREGDQSRQSCWRHTRARLAGDSPFEVGALAE